MLPTGTVSFLFTDIEGSTARWDRYPIAMRDAVRLHDGAMRTAVARFDGHVFKTVGDAFCVAFRTPEAAVASAVAAARALSAIDFTPVGGLRARMAIHLGTSDERDGDYFGPPLNRVARLVAIGHGGQILLSAVTAAFVRDHMPAGTTLRDLGEHRLKDLTVAERVFDVVADDLASDHAPLRSLSVQHNNLPRQLDALVGREALVRDVDATLVTDRIVTLLGPGGIGKTRIAIQTAADVLDTMPDGVWFVDLAPVAAGTLVANTIATALDLPVPVGRTALETVVDYLRTRHLLLVLDNCEHLIADAAETVATIARATPDVRMLATSREPLRVAGERVVRVPSLDVPPAGETLRAIEAMQFGAVALFVARARAGDARFSLTDATAPVVGEIVRRLDGIALAIELAAARVRVLGVVALAKRLDERFRLLTGGSRTALPRQQTMRALMDWSWEILTETERAILRRLGIFAGGWTLDLAESVCADEAIDAFDVLDTIGVLADKSLVATDADADAMRGRLLETTRAYALEKLATSGERDDVAARHAAAMAVFCERMRHAYDGNDAWFDSIEAELDNARAALEWSVENDPPLAARILRRTLAGYWWYRAPHEGLAWTARILARLDAVAQPALAADVHGIVGSYLRGPVAAAAYERGVALIEPLVAAGDRAAHERLAYLLGGLGSAYLSADRIAEAHATIERCIAVHRASASTTSLGFANVLSNRGTALGRIGDFAGARASFEAARSLFASLGDQPGVAVVALDAAMVEFMAGDTGAALAFAIEAATLYGVRKLSVGAAEARATAAACYLARADAENARASANESVRLCAHASNAIPCSALLVAADIAIGARAPDVASRLLDYVDAFTAREERHFDAIETFLRERLLSRLASPYHAVVARKIRSSEYDAADDIRRDAESALAEGAVIRAIHTA